MKNLPLLYLFIYFIVSTIYDIYAWRVQRKKDNILKSIFGEISESNLLIVKLLKLLNENQDQMFENIKKNAITSAEIKVMISRLQIDKSNVKHTQQTGRVTGRVKVPVDNPLWDIYDVEKMVMSCVSASSKEEAMVYYFSTLKVVPVDKSGYRAKKQ